MVAVLSPTAQSVPGCWGGQRISGTATNGTYRTSCTIPGEASNGTYRVGIQAQDTVGNSRVRSLPTGRPRRDVHRHRWWWNATVPAAPVSVSAVPGDASATVSWTAAGNGGSPITSYLVTSTPDGKTCSTTEATSCTVSELMNGTAYTFTVTATNTVGTSDPSTPSAAVTPAPVVPPPTVPAPPVSVSAVAGDAEAAVSWTAAGNGGSPIISYLVTSTPDEKTCSTTEATTCTVSELMNGTAYTFTVTATNTVGTSDPSTPSAAVTPAAVVPPPTVPAPPVSVSAVAGDAEAAVSWTAAGNGGSPITSYLVTSTPDEKTCSTTEATTCTVSELTNGTAYTFTVTATNTVGTSDPSTPSAAVTPAPWCHLQRCRPHRCRCRQCPGMPRRRCPGRLPGDGGSPITNYLVTSSPDGVTCPTTGATTCTVSGLANGTAYTFTVTATNMVGTSDPSTPSTEVTPEAVVPPPTVTVTIRATSGGTRLYVDVDPKIGRDYWTFQVQRKQGENLWQTLGTYRTEGSAETRTLNLPEGTYRVVVNPEYGYLGATSTEAYLRK